MKIKEIIKNISLISKVNREIKKYKYIHLMYNDKFNKPFVDFLNKNFDTKEHLVLCKQWIKDEKVAPFPVGENVVKIHSLFGLNLESKNIEKIIIHSLFDKEVVIYLKNHPDILKNKAYWVIWGGDLYGKNEKEKEIFVKKNMKGYVACIAGDELVAKNKYNSNSLLFSAPYTIPTTPEIVKNIVPLKSSGTINIQINNSSDKTIIEMLDILGKFKDENIKISTVLSYGNKDCKQEIAQKGREIFGEKFNPIWDFMSPEEYTRHIANLDIIIFNQNRQQGVGNAILAAYYGKKIFIKKEVTSYKYLTDKNICVFDTNTIPTLKFEEFVSNPPEIQDKTKAGGAIFFNIDYQTNAWKRVFESE